MPRLVLVFAGRTLILLVLSCRGSPYLCPSNKPRVVENGIVTKCALSGKKSVAQDNIVFARVASLAIFSCLRRQQSKLSLPMCCGRPDVLLPSGRGQPCIRSSIAPRERWFWLLPTKAWNSCFIAQIVFFFKKKSYIVVVFESNIKTNLFIKF